ncbi:hypothetical protein ABUE31_22600, partial [Mesorhizobium sp. ZMM04-5]
YIISTSELVQTFGTTLRRKQLLRNLLAYRGLMYANGYVSGIQFLDGSFVEDVERHSGREPGDIDVYSLLDTPKRYVQDPALWHPDGFKFWAEEIQNQPLNKSRFELDTYALLVQELPLVHLLKDVMYWYSLFSHQKVTFAWKGFVAILLDQQQDVDALALLGGS